MTKNTQVTLNDVEQRLVKTVAKARFESNREAGTAETCYIYPREHRYQQDIDGFGGELAFCKLFNVYPDTSTHVRTTKTDVGDCVWNGFSIDVKTTTYPEGMLLANYGKQVTTVDYYALMTGVFPNYFYRGVIEADELLKKERLANLGHPKPAYCVIQEELKELTTITEQR